MSGCEVLVDWIAEEGIPVMNFKWTSLCQLLLLDLLFVEREAEYSSTYSVHRHIQAFLLGGMLPEG